MTTKQKQCLLAYLGYYTGDIDGLWGRLSLEATKRFQSAYGLGADGIFGPSTESKIREVIASAEQPIQQPQETGSGADWWKEIRYFTRSDSGIACPCGRCGGFPAEPTEALMRLADKVRGLAGAPAFPSSTVRCVAHNAELKGSAPNSRHLRGKAMDFRVSGWSSATLLALVQQQSEVNYAYAIDGSYVHMDVQ